MSVADTTAEIIQPSADVLVVSEPEQPVVKNRDRLSRRVVALGVTGLMTLGIINTVPTADYANLAQANLEHTFGDMPSDPTSFDYLEQYEVNNGMFMDNPTGGYTQVWSHSQALSALHIKSLTPGNEDKYSEEFRRSLEASNRYWDDGIETGEPGYNSSNNNMHIGSQERFVDDNLWMGLIHMQEYEATGDTAQLDRAKQIFDLAMKQWDKQNGGIFWQVQWPGVKDHDRAMVSNAPAVQLGIELYRITGNEEYLTKSEEIFNWMAEHKDENEGTFHDHIRDDGTYDPSKYTYVQGVVAGAMAEMSQIMPDKYSLKDAVDLANTTLDSLDQGTLLRNPAFDAILYRNLLKISSIYKDPKFTKKTLDSLQKTVNNLPVYPTDLLELVGMLQLRTMLEVPESAYSKLF